jgi:tetratricopeptide (TPR) repeat protein
MKRGRSPSPQARPSGISLEAFHALIGAHGGRASFLGKSTSWVKHNVVLPATDASRASFAAQLLALESRHVAPATFFISHAYDDEFLGLVDSLEAQEASKSPRCGPSFYYFDLLCVNQHTDCRPEHVCRDRGAVVPFSQLRREFGESVRAIGRTLLYLRWANPTPLGRAWCVFEMGTTLEVGAGMTVIMPPADVTAFKEALVNDFDSLAFKTCRVDVEKATAREASDLANIQRAIVEGGGFLKTNQLVIGAMQGWMVEEARSALDAMPAAERGASCLATNLAELLRLQGKLGDAEPLYREALAARRRDLGDEHPLTLKTIAGVASLLRGVCRLAEAEPLYREALAARRRTLGHAHASTLRSIICMGVLLSDQGRLDEAEPLFREALAGAAVALGVSHAYTLDAKTNLAVLLQARGELRAATPLLREALEAYRSAQGREHPDTLRAMHNLAEALRDAGALAPAEALYAEALAVCRRTLGDTHPLTLHPMTGLATCLRRQGRFDEALPLAAAAHAGRCARLGAAHLKTCFSAHEQGVLLRLLGAPRRALPLARAAFEGRCRLQGPAARATLSSQLSLARLEKDTALAGAIAAMGVLE